MQQPLIAEHEAVVSLIETTADLIREPGMRDVEPGTQGTVVAVHQDGTGIVAYEVEFRTSGVAWGLATLLACDVDRPSSGRLFRAVVWPKLAGSIGLRVAVCATDEDEARDRLQTRYAGATVADLHDPLDAGRTPDTPIP